MLLPKLLDGADSLDEEADGAVDEDGADQAREGSGDPGGASGEGEYTGGHRTSHDEGGEDCSGVTGIGGARQGGR